MLDAHLHGEVYWPNMEYLKDLNPAQREAVLHTDGPLLVLAGAGSGKTRVIVHRILHLITSGVSPDKILAVTFTNKAAKEMRDRVMGLARDYPALARLFPDRAPLVTTFHSLGVTLLREQHKLLGLPRYFTIYDRSDSIAAMKRALESAGYGVKEFEPRKLLGIMSKAKGDARTHDTFEGEARSYMGQVVRDIWPRYEAILRENGALDFDDLLVKTLSLLQHNPDVLAGYQQRFTHLHIDEYQDTNRVQYEIARLLSGEHANICAVGDVDQNIYSWRGADMNNILKFERHFHGARTVLLEENYRSTKTIVAAANDIIEKNTARIPKTVFTKNADGDRISLFAAWNETEEANYIARTAAGLIADGTPADAIAVLYRANFQSRSLEEAFLEHRVPYQMLGTRFFERKEIKDMLSYLRLAQNPQSTGDLARIINVPVRGIGKVTLLKILEGKRETVTGKAAAGVAAFDALMGEIREAVAKGPISQALKYILERSELAATLKAGGEEGLERLENIRELVSLAAKYDALPGHEGAEKLLEEAALHSEQDALDAKSMHGVKLMTVHAAKGLEFACVFIAGLEEGLFPHERLSDERIDEEEERRLFYVALTRAEQKVFLSYAGLRTVFGAQRVNEPSSFLSDISDAYLESANPKESGFERTIYLD